MSYNSPHQRVISYVQQRQRAYSALPSFPYGPPTFVGSGFMNRMYLNESSFEKS